MNIVHEEIHGWNEWFWWVIQTEYLPLFVVVDVEIITTMNEKTRKQVL